MGECSSVSASVVAIVRLVLLQLSCSLIIEDFAMVILNACCVVIVAVAISLYDEEAL